MGNWKTTIKASDLADDQKLEMVCRKCGRLSYADRATLCQDAERSQLYLDEIEAQERCKALRCNGRMRMSMVRLKEISGFVGGLA